MYCTKCGKEIDDNALFCQNCGMKFEKPKQSIMQQKPVREKNFKWILMVIGCIGIVVLLYLSYFFAWIPQGKNLSACVGKKIGIVKIMHHVTQKNNGNYYIGDYFLLVDPVSNVVTGIGSEGDSGKEETKKYSIHGICFDQSEKEAKKYLKKKFISIGKLGYLLKSDPDCYFSVEFSKKKVSKLSLYYWEQDDREKEWVEEARSDVSDGNYVDACMLYEGIQDMDVQQELEECWYNCGKVLFDEGAYLDAEKYFNKLSSDMYSKEMDKYLKKISNVKKIFDLGDSSVDNRCTWYESASTTSSAYLIFSEADMETWAGNQDAYAVESWEGKGDLDSLNGKAEYQLKLRRLSDERICDAELSIHAIKASDLIPDCYINVSTLDIVVGEDVTNVSYGGVITQQIKTPITKSYTNSTQYNEAIKQISELRKLY